jgi:hypothetical protein
MTIQNIHSVALKHRRSLCNVELSLSSVVAEQPISLAYVGDWFNLPTSGGTG